MTSLLVLAAVLIAFWGWAMVARGRGAAFAEAWIHVPLVVALICIFMAIGLWIR